MWPPRMPCSLPILTQAGEKGLPRTSVHPHNRERTRLFNRADRQGIHQVNTMKVNRIYQLRR